MAERLLEVKDLHVHFHTEDGIVRAVDGVSFELERGKVLGIVGESGSGKSVSAMTLMGLTRDVNTRFEGEVIYKGRDLLKLPETAMQDFRGNEIGMIFQDPMTSLNPVYRVGEQIVEAIRTHEDVDKRQAKRRAVDLLRQVGIPRPEGRVDDYPHQFSGGMRQRAMIAMALSCNPDVLIADEPTTALDVTIQAQILELIDRLKDDFNSAVILITHDLGVVADVADEIIVMYAGRQVERGAKRQVFYDPQMPYTWGLLGSIPRLDRPIVRLLPPTAGEVVFQGNPIGHLGARALRPLRREMQMIFQDPYASLNPRKRVGSIIGDPLKIHGVGDTRERRQRVQELLETVGLSPEHYNRFPHEFSGGQRQRIGVARALALRPKLVVADEPVSALDVSIQAQMINLLDELQDEFGLTYIFIAHDLGVVRHVSDRIAVMYLGKLVEVSPAEELYQKPIMPYTEALLSAVPIPDPDLSDGLVNREIGHRLFLSEETVKSHVRHLLAKLQARSRAHAVAVGFRRGLIA